MTKFEWTEEIGDSRAIYTIFGEKGTGKTTFAFMFKGRKYCISFDHKSLRIKNFLYKDDSDIVVLDGLKYYDRSADEIVNSSKIAYQHIEFLLSEIKRKGDCGFIIFDGLERLSEICEMCMRADKKLTAIQGIPQMSFWKLRRLHLQKLHELALGASKKGVIYTTFNKYEEEIEDGTVIQRKPIPRYFDIIEEYTDTIFQTQIRYGNETRFMVKVITSKVPKYKTGTVLDVTMK